MAKYQIVKSGTLLGHPQGAYVIAVEDLEAIVANFKKRSIEVVVDYDHSTYDWGMELAGKAAGWIKDLWVEGDSVWGEIEWTAAASSLIEANEYKYLSPVIHLEHINIETGRYEGCYLESVGLTNIPAMDMIPVQDAVANSLRTVLARSNSAILNAINTRRGKTEETEPNHKSNMSLLKNLADKLRKKNSSLPENPTEAEIEAAVQALVEEPTDPSGTEGGEGKAAPPALEKTGTDPAVLAELADLKAKEAAREAADNEVLLNSCISDFRIPVAQKEFYAEQLKASPEVTRNILNNLPKNAHKPKGVNAPVGNSAREGTFEQRKLNAAKSFRTS